LAAKPWAKTSSSDQASQGLRPPLAAGASADNVYYVNSYVRLVRKDIRVLQHHPLAPRPGRCASIRLAFDNGVPLVVVEPQLVNPSPMSLAKPIAYRLFAAISHSEVGLKVMYAAAVVRLIPEKRSW
jgi:hypothetical protein